MAASAHLGVAMDRDVAEAIADGPLFMSHAKSGENFASKDAADAERSRSEVTDEEIAQVAQWIGMIAQQGGLKVPRPQTLF